MSINRRLFIKRAGLAGALVATGVPSWAARGKGSRKDRFTINIVHTNDVHSQIDPFPANSTRFPGQGGFSRRLAYTQKVRNIDSQTLVFDSGDFFQGTPYFNFYKGKLEIELMNRIGVDVVTIGNHEFDNGLDMLANRIKEAKFTFVNANYKFNHAELDKLVKPYTILERYGIRIGVFGLGVQLDGLVNLVQRGKTEYSEPVEVANRISKHLKLNEKCDLVVALTHIGYTMGNNQDDKALATNSEYIDLILGGHTHTFLEKPDVITNRVGRKVWVNQTGASGVYIGHLKLDMVRGGDGEAQLVACQCSNVAMKA